MHLAPHLSQVQDHLKASAALGDERTQQIADALAVAAAPAVRLALLEALTEAAEEITAALVDYPGSPAVAVRLDSDAIDVEVHATDSPADEDTRPEDGDLNARITLRLPENLKADVETAAERDGVSVNTWLVRAASAGLRRPGPGGPGFGPGFGHSRDWPGRDWPGRDWPNRSRGTRRRVTGWING